MEEERLLAECTFRPSTNAGGAGHSARGPAPTEASELLRERDDDPVERLQRAGHHAELKKQKLKMEKESKELENCFQPEINPQSRQMASSKGHVPLADRVADIQRQKALRLHQIKMKTVDKPSFAPELSEGSRTMVTGREAALDCSLSGPLSGPAAVYYKQVAAKRNKHRECFVKAEAVHQQECTFAPILSKTSEDLVALSAKYRNEPDFVERQEEFHKRKQAHVVELAKAVEASTLASGRPTISKTSDRIATQLAANQATDRLSRLAYQDAKTSADMKARLQEAANREFDFKPRIDHTSKKLTQANRRRSTIRADKSSPKCEAVMNSLRDELECRFKEAHPFQPQINKPKRPTQPTRGPLKTPADGLDVFTKQCSDAVARQAWRECQSKAKEDQELADCTFRPHINNRPRGRASSLSLDPPKGYASFLEKQARARQQQDEKARREQEAFGVKEHVSQELAQRALSFTVPKPFQLATANRPKHAGCEASLDGDVSDGLDSFDGASDVAVPHGKENQFPRQQAGKTMADADIMKTHRHKNALAAAVIQKLIDDQMDPPPSPQQSA
eukprot:NODE_454_length_2075_cov_32.446693_g362_i0.p1 GENE.NODE_454_length_2075_cov_32.446693_g362_i0~~NODE_454_length_2075_cov_32.446693_g362_i0.p1  ORF type:complete len:651 (-),score=212.68 NODE_454_length_2075_cov_32.446693_g362_i0:122-1813(-)